MQLAPRPSLVATFTFLAAVYSPHAAQAKPVAAEEITLEAEPENGAASAPAPAETGGIEESDGIEETDGIIETDGDAVPQELPGADTTLMVPFSGPRADTVQKRVRKALETDGIAMSPPGLAGDRKFGNSPIEYVGFGQETGVRGFVDGTVVMKDNAWSVSMNVRSASNGAVVGQASLSGKGLPALLKTIDERATEVLGEALAKTSMADPDGPAPTVQVDLRPAFANNTQAPAKKNEKRRIPSPLDLQVGVSFLVRNFSYQDSLADVYEYQLVPHQNVGLAMPMVEVRWFPGAHSMKGIAAHVGLEVQFRRSIGGNTIIDANYPTTFQEFIFGVRGRLPIGHGELGIFAGVGQQSLIVEGDNINDTNLSGRAGPADPGIIPDIEYSIARFGIDGRFPITDMFSIEPAVFARTATISDEAGHLGEDRWFPDATVDGIEGRLALAMQFTKSIGIKLGADIRQYGLFMNIDQKKVFANDNTTDLSQAVAGGATDRYVGGFAALSYQLPGKGSR